MESAFSPKKWRRVPCRKKLSNAGMQLKTPMMVAETIG